MPQEDKKYYSVMLIDDNEIDNIINTKIIESTNLCEVIYSNSSAQGAIDFLKNIAKICQPNDPKLPAYIFLDIDMPVMDGFQFLDEFKRLDKIVTSHCKIIMLTASINPKDKETASQYKNFINFINKPLRADDLAKL